MASLRVRAAEENPAARLAEGKNVAVSAAEPARRRALGDIGNVNGVLTRAQAAKAEKAGVVVKPGQQQQLASAAAKQQQHHHQQHQQQQARPPPPAPAARAPAVFAAPAPAPAPASHSALLRARASHAAPPPDIDSADRHDPLCAPEYAAAIHAYLRRAEPRFAPDCGYMARQAEVNEKMRAILVDWLVEVHLKFKLMPETLFLTVNLIDRYLARAPVTRKKLQLVGVTAMLVASKYEEIWAPEVRDFVYISDKAYGRDEILGMEKAMLNALAFDLTVPTPFPFLARYRKAAAAGGAAALLAQAQQAAAARAEGAGDKAAAKAADGRVAHLAQYYSELALVDYGMLQVAPSLLAAGALHLALVTAGMPAAPAAAADDAGENAAPSPPPAAAGSPPCRELAWPPAAAAHSGYSLPEVQRVARALAKLARHAPDASLKAVHKKHGSTRYGEVAKAPVPEEALLR